MCKSVTIVTYFVKDRDDYFVYIECSSARCKSSSCMSVLISSTTTVTKTKRTFSSYYEKKRSEMNENEKKVIQKNYILLLDDLEPKDILPRCLANGVLTEADYETVKSLTCREDRVVTLISKLKAKSSLSTFIQILHKTGLTHIGQSLEDEAERSKQDEIGVFDTFINSLKEFYLDHFTLIRIIKQVPSSAVPIRKCWVDLGLQSKYSSYYSSWSADEVLEYIHSEKLPVVFSGPAGYGKTTLTQRLCFEWAAGDFKQYDLLLILPLRDVLTSKDSIIDLVFAWLEPRLAILQKKDNIDTIKQVIRMKSKNLRILVVIDGLDEYSKHCGQLHQILSTQSQLLPFSLVMTCRPHMLELIKCNYSSVTVKGWKSFDSQKAFVEMFFKESQFHSDSSAEEVINALTGISTLREMGSCPLLLYYICLCHNSLFHKVNPKGGCATVELIAAVCNMLVATSKEKISASSEMLSENWQDDLMVQHLGEMALTGIVQHVPQVKFSQDELRKWKVSDELLKIGFLNAEEVVTMGNLAYLYQFPHRSFQEFFAAMVLLKEIKVIQEKNIRWPLSFNDVVPRNKEKFPWFSKVHRFLEADDHHYVQFCDVFPLLLELCDPLPVAHIFLNSFCQARKSLGLSINSSSTTTGWVDSLGSSHRLPGVLAPFSSLTFDELSESWSKVKNEKGVTDVGLGVYIAMDQDFNNHLIWDSSSEVYSESLTTSLCLKADNAMWLQHGSKMYSVDLSRLWFHGSSRNLRPFVQLCPSFVNSLKLELIGLLRKIKIDDIVKPNLDKLLIDVSNSRAANNGQAVAALESILSCWNHPRTFGVAHGLPKALTFTDIVQLMPDSVKFLLRNINFIEGDVSTLVSGLSFKKRPPTNLSFGHCQMSLHSLLSIVDMLASQKLHLKGLHLIDLKVPGLEEQKNFKLFANLLINLYKSGSLQTLSVHGCFHKDENARYFMQQLDLWSNGATNVSASDYSLSPSVNAELKKTTFERQQEARFSQLEDDKYYRFS